MKWFLYCIALMSTFAPPSFANDITLRFAISAPGSSPYIFYNEKTKSYEGVVVDFFRNFQSEQTLHVVYMDSSRARNEKLLQNGQSDIFLSSKIWLKNRDSFIFSDTLMPHNSYMYALQPFTSSYLPQHNVRSLICTRYGFVYPVLDSYFNSNLLIKVNSSSQSTMTHMLAKGRCDLAIMSEENARAIMYRDEFCSTAFYQSPNVISAVDLVFVISKQHESMKHEIDKNIKAFIHSGQRKSSIERHATKLAFPKPVCDRS